MWELQQCIWCHEASCGTQQSLSHQSTALSPNVQLILNTRYPLQNGLQHLSFGAQSWRANSSSYDHDAPYSVSPIPKHLDCKSCCLKLQREWIWGYRARKRPRTKPTYCSPSLITLVAPAELYVLTMVIKQEGIDQIQTLAMSLVQLEARGRFQRHFARCDMMANRSGRWHDEGVQGAGISCAVLHSEHRRKCRTCSSPQLLAGALGESHKRHESYVIIGFNGFYV